MPRYVISGPRLRHIREQYGVSCTDIAEELGISRSELSKIEQARRPIPKNPLFLNKDPKYKVYQDIWEKARASTGSRRFARAYLGIVAVLVSGAPPVRDLMTLLRDFDDEAKKEV